MRNVLLVEDNRWMRRALKRFLQAAGYSVDSFGEFAGAMTCLDLTYDAIVFDYMNDSNITAFEFVSAVRSRPGFNETILIAITGWPYLPESLPIDHFLQKPFDLNQLESLIRGG